MKTIEEILAAIQAGEFATLTDEELAAGRAAIRETLTAHKSGEAALADDERDVMLEAGRAVIAEQSARATAVPESDPVDDLVAGLADPEPAPEPVRPSVADIAAKRPAVIVPDPEPEVDDAPVEVLVAAAGYAGEPADTGDRLDSQRALGEAMARTHKAYSGPTEGRVMPRVARRTWSSAVASLIPNDGASALTAFGQAFSAGQARAKSAIDAGFSPAKVLQAATGICGPTEPVYDVFTIGSATAGIIDLPSVNLARGKVSYPEPLTYDDLRETDGIAYKYTSDDGAGIHGDVVKDCYTVACGDAREFELAAFQTCLKFSNFQGMFNPEYVGHVTTQSLMTHAHRVNRDLIQGIQDDTRTIDYVNTGDKGGGAITQFVRQVAFHASLYRDKYRLSQDQVLEVVVPYMVMGALIADGVARPDGLSQSFDIANAISRVQAQLNVRVQFVYDYIEGVAAPGDYGDQPWRMLVFPAGTIVHVGAQTLDLGEVRDSTYNSRNEYGTWVETFDGIAVVGPEVMQVTALELCPNGATGAAESITCTSGASSS